MVFKFGVTEEMMVEALNPCETSGGEVRCWSTSRVLFKRIKDQLCHFEGNAWFDIVFGPPRDGKYFTSYFPNI